MHHQHARRRHVAHLLGILTLLVLLVGAWRSSPARAHSDLIRSEPGFGDTLRAIPEPVLLHFDEPVELTAAVVELSRNNERIEPPKPVHASGNKRTVAVPLTSTSAGGYLLRWFFFGYDGHLMAGELTFRVNPTAPGPAVAAPNGTASPAASGETAAAAPSWAAERASSRFAPAERPSETPVSSADTPPTTEAFDGAGDLPAGFLPTGTDEAASTPLSAAPRSFRPGQTAGAEAVVRFGGYASMAVLVGGACFVVLLWPEGAGLARTRRLLWLGLVGALVSTLLTLGLKGAALRGLSPVSAFRPSVVGTVFGTHFANVFLARAGFLLAAAPLLTLLARRPERAVSSWAWRFSAYVVGAGVVATYCLTGHAYTRGVAATLAAFVHLAGATIWLGGLAMLAVVVLPRRRWEEATLVVPGFSALAGKAVAVMALAGAALFWLLSPRWGGLPASGWGQLLFVKLGLVGLILLTARGARSFTLRYLVRPAEGAVSLRPLVAAVGVEVVLAVGVLTATAMLVSRNPPG